MKKQYEEINALNKKKGVTVEKGLCKLAEEFGELAQACNVVIGIKTKKDVNINDLIAEEAADTIQNVFSICNLMGIKYETIVKALITKNDKWRNIKRNKPTKKK